MVEINLRELSAPLEAIRSDVEAAYKRLDDKWEEISEQLKKLPIPCTVGYMYSEHPNNPEDYDRIEWRKHNGRKRICLVSYRWNPDICEYGSSEVSVTPYEEWSAEQRVSMLRYVPRLFDSALKETKAFIKNTDVQENFDEISSQHPYRTTMGNIFLLRSAIFFAHSYFGWDILGRKCQRPWSNCAGMPLWEDNALFT